jgi:hypothetical protein
MGPDEKGGFRALRSGLARLVRSFARVSAGVGDRQHCTIVVVRELPC